MKSVFVILSLLFCICHAQFPAQFGLTSFPTTASNGSSHAKSIYETQGRLLVGGIFSGTVWFQGIKKTSYALSQDIFIALESSYLLDTVEWVNIYGRDANDYLNAIAVDSNNDIVFVGQFSGSTNYGGSTLNSSAAGNSIDMSIVKLDSNGVHIWSYVYGVSTGNEIPQQMSIDSNNNIIINGQGLGTTNWGGSDLPGLAGQDVVVAKYNSSGACLWSLLIGGIDDDTPTGIAVDSQGNIYSMMGGYSTSITLNASITLNTSTVLVKFDSEGSILWYKPFGVTVPGGVGVDSLNNVIISGTIYSSTNFGLATNLSLVGSSDAVAVKYDPSGNAVWQIAIGGVGPETGLTVAIAADGSAYVGGSYQYSFTFNNTVTQYSNGWGLMLSRVYADGTPAWAAGFAANIADVSGAIVFPISNPSPNLDGAYITTGFTTACKDLNGNLIQPKGVSDNSFLAAVGVPPLPSPSVTPTASVTPSVTPSAGFTPSPTSTPTPSLSVSATPSPHTTPQDDITINATKLFAGSINSIATDSSHNIFVAGSSEAPNEIDGIPFLAKLDMKLNTLWNKTYDNCSASFFQIALDSQKNVIVVGNGYETQFDGLPYLIQGYFVLKYDNDGNFLWGNITNTNTTTAWLTTVTVDSSDYIYVAGNDDAWFGAKFSSAGDLQWYSVFPGTSSSLHSIDVTSDGLGYLLMAGGPRAVLFRELFDGTYGWSENYGIDEEDTLYWTGYDSTDAYFAAGACKNSTATDEGHGDYDVCIYKFSASFDGLVWGQMLGGRSAEYVSAGAIGRQDALLLAGSYSSNFSLGGDVLVAGPDIRCFVAQFDNAGFYEWHHSVANTGQVGSCQATAITGFGSKSTLNDVLAAIYFTGNVTVNGITYGQGNYPQKSSLLIKYNVTPQSDQQSSSPTGSSGSEDPLFLVIVIVPCVVGVAAVILITVGIFKKMKGGKHENRAEEEDKWRDL